MPVELNKNPEMTVCHAIALASAVGEWMHPARSKEHARKQLRSLGLLVPVVRPHMYLDCMFCEHSS